MDTVGAVSEALATAQASPAERFLRAEDSSLHRAPCVWVRRISAALDFYLAVDCDIHRVDNGRVQLSNGNTRFVLGDGGDPCGTSGSLVPELTTPDLMGLCRRLRALGVETGPIAYPCSAPDGRIEVRDPDQHTVVIRQVGATASTATPHLRQPHTRDVPHQPSAHVRSGPSSGKRS